MKFAYLVMTELRSLDKTIQQLYDYIITPYDADIFICVQQTFSDDNEKIKLFNKNVVHSEIYTKPDPNIYFGTDNNINIRSGSWCIPSNLQIYINYHKMSQIIEKYVDKYDYFITIRTDVCILFPFPDKQFFENIPNALYSVDATYCKNWGGCGFSVFIHKKFIMNYLMCYYNIISNKIYKHLLINNFNKLGYDHSNQENFFDICLKIMNNPGETHSILDNKKYIKNINYYYTAKTLNAYTTWSKPSIHPIYNVICKYEGQCDEAYQNFKIWQNGKWKYDNDCIFLE
jgi:hypothetical protein